jgi:hypothetical protein
MSKDLRSLLIGLAVIAATTIAAVGLPWLSYRANFSDANPHPQEAIWNR